MREQSSIMQSRCACAVDAVCLSLPGFRKVSRLHGPEPWHGSFDGLHLVEIKYIPTKSCVQTTGARGASVASAGIATAAARPTCYLCSVYLILILYSNFNLFRTKPCFSSETFKI